MKTDSDRFDDALDLTDDCTSLLTQLRDLGWTIEPPPERLGKLGDVRWFAGAAWICEDNSTRPWASGIGLCRTDAEMAGSVPMRPVPDGHVVVPEDRVLPEVHVPLDISRVHVDIIKFKAAGGGIFAQGCQAELARREKAAASE